MTSNFARITILVCLTVKLAVRSEAEMTTNFQLSNVQSINDCRSNLQKQICFKQHDGSCSIKADHSGVSPNSSIEDINAHGDLTATDKGASLDYSSSSFPAQGSIPPTELKLKIDREIKQWRKRIDDLLEAHQPAEALRELDSYSKSWPERPLDHVYAEAYLMAGNEDKAIEHFRKHNLVQGNTLAEQEALPTFDGPSFLAGINTTPRFYLKFAMILFRRGERDAATTLYYEEIRRGSRKDNSSREILPFEFHFEEGQPGRHLRPTIENFNAACHLWMANYDPAELGVKGHLEKAISYAPSWTLPRIYLALNNWADRVPKDEIRSLLAIAETPDERKLLQWLLQANYRLGEGNVGEWDHSIGYKRRSENPAFLSGIKRMRSVWQKIAGRWKD
jgi:hypothetical protein